MSLITPELMQDMQGPRNRTRRGLLRGTFDKLRQLANQPGPVAGSRLREPETHRIEVPGPRASCSGAPAWRLLCQGSPGAESTRWRLQIGLADGIGFWPTGPEPPTASNRVSRRPSRHESESPSNGSVGGGWFIDMQTFLPSMTDFAELHPPKTADPARPSWPKVGARGGRSVPAWRVKSLARGVMRVSSSPNSSKLPISAPRLDSAFGSLCDPRGKGDVTAPAVFTDARCGSDLRCLFIALFVPSLRIRRIVGRSRFLIDLNQL